jgi:hypothetical protein
MEPEHAQARFGRPVAILVDAPFAVAEISAYQGNESSGRRDSSLLIRYSDAEGTKRITLTTSYTTAAVADAERLMAVLADALLNFPVAETEPTLLDKALLRSLAPSDDAASYALFDGFVDTATNEAAPEREWLMVSDGRTSARATLQDNAAIIYISNYSGYRPRIRMGTSS